MKILLILEIIKKFFDFLAWTKKYARKRHFKKEIKDAIEFAKASASGNHDRAIAILKRWL